MEFAGNRPLRGLITPEIFQGSRGFFMEEGKVSKNTRTLFPLCPLRKIITERGVCEIYCKASGSGPLSSGQEEEALLIKTCGECTIPKALEAKMRPCLYLVPLRFTREKCFKTGFSCRWFHSLEEGDPKEEVWVLCGGCPHWFPRPPDEDRIPGTEKWAEKMVKKITESKD